MIEQTRKANACACFNLRKAARAVTQLYDDALRPSGLRATQWSLLMVIRARGVVAVSELAEHAVMDRTTLTRNLKPLERDGLIRIRPGEDRRVREVTLTRRGQAALGRAYPLWREAQAGLAKRLGSSRLAQTVANARRVVERIRE